MALNLNAIVHYNFSLALVLKAIGVGNLNFPFWIDGSGSLVSWFCINLMGFAQINHRVSRLYK